MTRPRISDTQMQGKQAEVLSEHTHTCMHMHAPRDTHTRMHAGEHESLHTYGAAQESFCFLESWSHLFYLALLWSLSLVLILEKATG